MMVMTLGDLKLIVRCEGGDNSNGMSDVKLIFWSEGGVSRELSDVKLILWCEGGGDVE